MNFKSWFILSEELYLQNNTATIFHRTTSFEDVQGMMNGGFTAGGGAFHGPGLYATYTLEGTTDLDYGDYVVKLKLKNLKNYFVFEPDIAKQIHGNNWKLKDQARILELTLKLTDEQWQKYQEISEKGQFGSAAASKVLKDDGHFLWEHGCKGIVYNGEQDGKCICVYAPYEGLQFLAYAYAPTPTTVNYIEKNWVKSSKGVSIRSISDLKFPKDTEIGSTSVEKQYQLSDLKNLKGIPDEILNQILKAFKVRKFVKLKFYLSRNKLSDQDIHNLCMRLIAHTTNIDKRETMVNLIIKHKTELSGQNVYDLINLAPDKEKIARILGQENINKLDDLNVSDLLRNASDKDQMARILGQENINKLLDRNIYYLISLASDKEKIARILGQANINKLNDRNVSDLLHFAPDKDQVARILGQANIDKLTSDNVNNLLKYASDQDQMARILGPDNINKLNVVCVRYLLGDTPDKEKMARILGSDNINKLTGENVSDLLDSASDKKEMKQILRKYYTGTNQEVISLLNQNKSRSNFFA